ncbi:U1 small nuclear ribonucleoprotein usp102 [Taphrina deformans PYCC 5710]|uniref:U1 small nuclear ribonucleoprotein usp102 n=1 Tax=Taphrina deformans (strain PYCC 5710 / ATCC 11124 / CBS 356.35 / IMI 108563 / JCM 9778 / NBRC 8474) TaxID=1097556 RepID=R4X7B8_TAPDE|nr:U1 small nuclear ribonucleoprotein usp102 [Taphrina deformans PYCC 5710]|eukprot:CCG81211.1 U1 small nuclear ribonucleoprotein usp102 [Taphrina deformans PYCC 5710]
MDVAPNQSLYINNLNDSLRKADLKLNLYILFSTYGTVLDVVALKTQRMRGQAHVVFKDIASASQAIKACNGMDFFGKSMKVTYAKSRSDVIDRLEGTFIPGQRRSAGQSENPQGLPPNETIYIRNLNERIPITSLKRDLSALFAKYGSREIIAHKNIRMRGQAFIVFDQVQEAEKAIRDLQGYPLEDKPMLLQFAKSKSDRTVNRVSPDELEQHKEARIAAKTARGPLKSIAKDSSSTKKPMRKAVGTKPVASADGNPPHKILFIQNLPEEITVDVMQAIFARYPGFRDVRMVPGRKGIAFVEYGDDESAITAKEGTAGMTLSGQQLKVTYGKKV